MNVVSFYAPRPEHPFFQDYTPFLDLLRASCAKYGHKHVVLTDDASVGRDGDAFVSDLPHALMPAYLKAQLDYLEAHPDTPSLMTGADCVLAADPVAFERFGADIVITVDHRFKDCHINMGAIYLPRPGLLVSVWRDALARCGEVWGDDQRAFRDALDAAEGLLITEVPCDRFNRAPETPDDDCKAVVLHFRGARKAWMAAYCHAHLGIGEGVRIKMAPNTDTDVAVAQITANMAIPREIVVQHPAHGGCAVLVGSGPSAAGMVDDIRARKEAGGIVFGLNGAARWLLDNGIRPQFGVLLDMREGNKRFIDGVEPEFGWLMASHCHPDVVASAPRVALFHHGATEYREYLPQGATMIGGGPTVGISAMYLAAVLGFRRLDLFGFDSSFTSGQTHLLPQPINGPEAVVMDVHVGPRVFHTNVGMYAQAAAFEGACNVLCDGIPEIEIAVHGDGLLPAIAHQMQANSNAALAA